MMKVLRDRKEALVDENMQNIVQLQDEQGNDISFEHLMTIQHEGSYYVVLEAVQDMEECMEGESIILKIVQDEQGEDMYVTVEDEEEMKAVFDKCVKALEEQENEENIEDDGETDDENGVDE